VNKDWPDPTEDMLKSPLFDAIWQTIKTWDINVPKIDGHGLYSRATGNHVRAIMDTIHRGVGSSMIVMGEVPLDRGKRHTLGESGERGEEAAGTEHHVYGFEPVERVGYVFRGVSASQRDDGRR